MKRKICVVTGTRADYGLLRWLIQLIKDDDALTLQIIATGMHLSPEFGLTYRDIEKDGFLIDRKVEMLMSSDSAIGISKSMGLAMIGFADSLSELKPDLMVVLGDRFEIFSAVSAALIARIPVAHLHGGELTEGAFDDALRHSITKMSHLHFVAAEDYLQRVIQLGETADRVFLVGGLGLDSIDRLNLLTQQALEESLGFKFGKFNLLITFHPVTLEFLSASDQMIELLAALSELKDTNLIFTLPNADTDGRVIISLIEKFVSEHSNACVFASLGQLRYLSCISHVDGVVGNSSSGLLEVPTFKKGTINIGDRQRGRLMADSVINVEPNRMAISDALHFLFSGEFQSQLTAVKNPYGNAGASKRILSIIKDFPLRTILKKTFNDSSKFSRGDEK